FETLCPCHRRLSLGSDDGLRFPTVAGTLPKGAPAFTASLARTIPQST
ncbi:MAG: hypothetical protein RLZZ341_1052, partial [Pseudomonadota bacterium]